MSKREQIINLIQTLPEEKLISTFDLVADELIENNVSKEISGKTTATLDKAGYIIFKQTYNDDVVFDTDSKLVLSYKKRPIEITVDKCTILPQKYAFAGEAVYIIGKVDNTCVAKAIVPDCFYNLFSSFNTTESKLDAMKTFINLPENQQAIIKTQHAGIKHPIATTSAKPITDISTLRFMFDMCRSSYTPQQQVDIEGIFDDQKSLVSTSKSRAARRLSYILNINQSCPYIPDLTEAEFIAKLDKYLYKHTKVKKKLAQAFVASKYTKRKGFAVLLVGPPGVGKTRIMKAVAKALEIPFHIISLASASSIVDLVGDTPQYDASDSGEPVKTYYKYKTTRMVMGLDEFDNCYEGAKEGGKISKVFTDALSGDAFFKDVFLGTYINTENTIFIATANSTASIPRNLLNRFIVIHVDDYDEKDKMEIARKFTLPEILADFGIDKSEIRFNDSALKHIIRNFCEDDGARDLEKNIKAVVNKVLSLWDSSGKREVITIDKVFVDTTLEDCLDKNSPAIIYHRNKQLYSPEIAEEIKLLLSKVANEELDFSLREKYAKKLELLVNLIPVGNAFSDFNKKTFYEQVNSTHFGMESVKTEIAEIFNLCSINNKPLSSIRLLLVGPAGIGKSSIIRSIAKACNSKYCKISLNGVSDDATLKGHSFTYVGADAGSPIKAIAKMKTTKGIVQLDEIDKLGSKEGHSVSNTLVDLLDDSVEFTDNFIGQPINLSGLMFIATANDISAIDPILLDRFTVIHLDGYTESEKEEIISNHLIPKAISELAPKDYSISFSDEAQKLIRQVYCRSLGVRDAEKAVRKLIRNKLYIAEETTLVIDTDDIRRVFGPPPAERGNFPHEVYPGLSKALAVTGNNCGMAFSVETMLIPDESSLTITGLPKESTIDSVKLAISYVKRYYPGMLTNNGIHVHFGEGAVQKDGPSAGVAILMSLLSATFDTSISENVAYTGEINGNGFVFNIGGTVAKIQAAQQSGCTRVFIPFGNYNELDKETLSQFTIEVVPVNHVSQVISAVLPSIGNSEKTA